jgi:hypothetical protein
MGLSEPWGDLRRRVFLFALRWRIIFRRSEIGNDPKWRSIFHWQHSNGVTLSLWAGVIAMIALGAQLGQPWPFYVGYLFGFGAYAWSVASWFTSDALRNRRRVYKKRKQREYSLSPLAANAMAVGAITAFFFGALAMVMHVQRVMELSAMNGELSPADDLPVLHNPCRISKTSSAVVAIFGLNKGAGFTDSSGASHLSILTVHHRVTKEPDQTFLSLDRQPDGNVSVNVLVVDAEGRTVLEIDKSHFMINKNGIFNSDSPPRPNRSTLLIQDQYHNILNVSMLNHNVILFQGKLFYSGSAYVEFSDEGIFAGPPRRPMILGSVGGFCADMNGNIHNSVIGMDAP